MRRSSPAALAGLLSVCAALAVAPLVHAAEVPDPAWSNYGTYYSTTVVNGTQLTGTDLLTALRTKISSMTDISYDNARLSIPITDRIYGAAPGTGIVGVYDRSTLVGAWDGGSTWNREHLWPQSKLGTVSNHDLFDLRPAKISTNGGRANNSYGGFDNSGNLVTGTYRMLPVRTGASTAQFFPGDYDKGDVARALFYMTTRYSSLHLIATADGQTSSNDTNVGDLAAALHWNYIDMPDNFERRRNQLIYKNTENSSLSQNNRNPYVDHPEYVWSVFGGGLNNSQITVASATNGASSKSVSLGRVIVGGTVPAASLTTAVTINKTGVDPTTYSVATSGLATADEVDSTAADRSNRFNGFDYNTQSRSLTVGLSGVSTATAGVQGGTVTIDNTDITTGGAGTGSADGDDTVNLSVNVLDHSDASFDATDEDKTLIVNFGAVDKGKTARLGFSIANLLSASGYTAGLDLDGVTGDGETSAFGTGLSTFAAMAAGTSEDFLATFTPTHSGAYNATYTLAVSDEDLSGATASTLTLILSGVAGSRTVPEPVLIAAVLPAWGLLRRRRA